MSGAASTDDAVDDAGDRNVGVDALHPCVADDVGCHRAGRLADDLRQVDAVHYFLGEGYEVEAPHNRVDVYPADDGIDVDPFHNGVHIDALCDRVDIDLGHDGVDVHLARYCVNVYLADDRVDVHLAHNRIHVHLTQHPVDVHLAQNRVDVHAVHDCGDVDCRDQYVDVDALLHKRSEIQTVEYLVYHRWNHSRDDPAEVIVRRCSRQVAPISEGFDHTGRMQSFVQNGRTHNQPADRRGRPHKEACNRHGRIRRQCCHAQCRIYGIGHGACRRGSGVRFRHAPMILPVGATGFTCLG